jgi:hypothetical protein
MPILGENVRRIRRILGNSNWAFTGSLALWYHAIKAGAHPRSPDDIDIAVGPRFFDEAIALMVSGGWKIDQEKSSIRNKHIVLVKGTHTVDVFVAGSELAPSMRHRVKYYGLPPIMNLNGLLKQKKNINLPRTKNTNNVSFIRKLGGKTPVKTLVKSPVMRTLNRGKRLSFGNN